MNKIAIVFGLLLIIAVGYIIIDSIQERTFVKGYTQGQVDLIISLNRNSQFPLVQGNQTYFVSLQDLCSG